MPPRHRGGQGTDGVCHAGIDTQRSADQVKRTDEYTDQQRLVLGRDLPGRSGAGGQPRLHHLDGLLALSADRPEGCEECLRDGTQWVHLRQCLNCGHVGCCDSSPERHATKHFEATDHPVMVSA